MLYIKEVIAYLLRAEVAVRGAMELCAYEVVPGAMVCGGRSGARAIGGRRPFGRCSPALCRLSATSLAYPQERQQHVPVAEAVLEARMRQQRMRLAET